MATTKKGRKATFRVELKAGKRVFHAVNKRAHTVCRKGGKRSVLSVSELRALKNKGTYKFYFYDATGNLKPVRF